MFKRFREVIKGYNHNVAMQMKCQNEMYQIMTTFKSEMSDGVDVLIVYLCMMKHSLFHTMYYFILKFIDKNYRESTIK